jgi:hypothetical protein
MPKCKQFVPSTTLSPITTRIRFPGVAPLPAPSSSLFLASRNKRPLWFDGRFLAAGDLRQEQFYFLRRQAYFGQAGGSGVVHGLTVDQGSSGQIATKDTIVVRAGVGIAPSGELVMISQDLTIQLTDLPDEENLDEQFGLSETPQQPARTRTGIYIIALQPVQFTANPIVSYPASLGSAPVAQDGDVVEASAVSLIPYPNPVNNFDGSLQQSVLARQIFLEGGMMSLPATLLPLAMISLDRNAIQWIDMHLVRRDGGPQSSAVHLGLSEPATQQAYLMQYDAQLKNVVNSLPANTAFSASTYFDALPPVGALPVACINPTSLTQIFFPQQTSVRLSLVPGDELPVLIQDSMSLPPFDLTQPASSFANLAIVILVPVARSNFASLKATLPDVQLNAALLRLPIRTLLPIFRLLPGEFGQSPPVASANGWPGVLGGLTYVFYARLRDQPNFVPLPTTS